MRIPSKPSLAVSLSALAASGVYAVGLPWFMLPVALGVFLWSVVFAESPVTLKRLLWLNIVFFWIFYAVVLSWFLDTDISLLAGLDKAQSPLVLGFCLITMATVLTIASLPFGVALYALRSRLRQPDFFGLLALASTWAIVEWLRSLAFSIFTSAPEGSIGDYWNFGSLGLGVISTPMGYFSRIIGMYGLSMLVIALGMAFCWALKKHYKPLAVVLILVVIGSGIGYKLMPASVSQPVEARLLQGEDRLSGLEEDVPIRNKSDNLKDLIVLPEYSRLYDTENEDFKEEYVTRQLSDAGVVIDVAADFTNPAPRHSFLLARSKNQVIDSQTKRLLIPTGEYLPSIVKTFYALTGQTKIIDEFASTRKLEKGDYPHIVSTPKLRIAPVACSGILGRNIYRQLVNNGGEVLTNSASLATFAGSKSYFRQSLQMARFHAVANSRPFIQATIGAPGFVLDNNGKFILRPDGSATEFADFSFVPNSNKTFYTKYGDWPLIISGLFMTGCAGYLVIEQRRKSSK